MQEKKLAKLFKTYKMPTAEEIAAKMLQEVAKSTPEEIGRVILRSKRSKQVIVNLQSSSLVLKSGVK